MSILCKHLLSLHSHVYCLFGHLGCKREQGLLTPFGIFSDFLRYHDEAFKRFLLLLLFLVVPACACVYASLALCHTWTLCSSWWFVGLLGNCLMKYQVFHSMSTSDLM